MTPVKQVVGGDGQSQRAFGPAHRVWVGRTDERAWTALAARDRHLYDNRYHRDLRQHWQLLRRLGKYEVQESDGTRLGEW